MVESGSVFDVEDAARKLGLPMRDEALTIDTLLADGSLESLQRVKERIPQATSGLPVEAVKLHSPILNPEKILLVAVNYASHSKEQNAKPPTEPYLFTKFRNSLIGPGDAILIPKVSKRVDWEVELSVIIGRAGKYVTKKDAMSYVAGYSISNDISFRDFQFATKLPDGRTMLGLNWVKGKGLDSSFPLGPWLVTKDDVEDPHNLNIALSVNGETKQRSNTNDMVFTIDSLIEYISAGITLKPGDIISTGTPEGVAAFTGGRYLKDGDVVEATIDRIGTLRNPVRAE